MVFVPQYKLKSGMKIAYDIRLDIDGKSKAILLTKGSILTKNNIKKLIKFHVPGAYIDDGVENIILNEKTRKESLSAIKRAFDMCENTCEILDEDTVNQIQIISKNLVDNICMNDEITVSISDLHSYDEDTYLHSLSVTLISIAIGTSLGLNKEKLCNLGVCAMLHDIGKVEIPIEIISKPSKLTEEEYNIVKRHPQLGLNYIRLSKVINKDIYLGIVSHHEKFDGTGYPNGLKGEKIHLFGRIIAVADVYDALTGRRPYRDPIKPSEGIEYIMGGIGTSFDYNVVKAFLEKIEPYPIGSHVILSDKRRGIIMKGNIDNPLRPIIKIIGENEEVLDLYNNFNLKNIVISGIDYSYLKNM
ncbi:HD-GYP domain-containing protein [Clostridium saccharobutylicum]|uniref:Cyclic di-GMP phosphodiesterase response regulator RpfG n=1 Tax=Clostridium saccharobutylicum DSM 13864 TaxID=1345695 RepID=U5MWU5_CLOSA|nr:HD-GYP domain-containing protein [Clostridium saccharobutylicum]AGX44106.1 cyclic di-GMP phosphodiesterase response regulator RpfG [Clostridium saccharobutylicum DSM 13864]AQR91396.1 cyclic di-GMP phosphodiesterase response regulator RpfG [Clostridium saccharobutylicum]AQS01300.1 cyclic di-GMP phosphodiesterase response regulator RpfG [Clostridium saccharobutylicum]AQS10910.1 cyclic di-GMP phosphodiesterase response regulator RpfG [Clostridium saccharobutylicum]AQS15283.1 cyclic di-GMP phos